METAISSRLNKIMIIIVFGLAASGKTYVGKILNKYFDFHHEDADHWLSMDMKQYIIEKKLFTLDMLESFTSNIIVNIELLREKHKNIVITQALYRSKNRKAIQEYFTSKDEIIFLQVDAADDIIYQRLINRKDWVFPEYAVSMRQFFEPMDNVNILQNNQEGEATIL